MTFCSTDARRIHVWRMEINQLQRSEEEAAIRPCTSRTGTDDVASSSATSSSSASFARERRPKLLSRVKAKLSKLARKEPEPVCKTHMYRQDLKLTEWAVPDGYTVGRAQQRSPGSEVDIEACESSSGVSRKRMERFERAERLLKYKS